MPDTPPPATGIERLLAVMRQLRAPDGGCPWDLEQTFETIAPYTIEEAYEVAEAIRQDDMAALRDELGDLLLQVVFHAQMADERGTFDFDQVAGAIADKMIRRHPHVFDDRTIESADAQTRAWEDQKAEERAAKAAAEGRAPSALEGVALGLPALLRAEKLQKRAARVGFDWPNVAPVLDKIEEEIGELRRALDDAAADPADRADQVAEELGDLLFACVNFARHAGIESEAALRDANAKFETRFRAIEALLGAQGRAPGNADLDELERLWQAVKAAERNEDQEP